MIYQILLLIIAHLRIFSIFIDDLFMLFFVKLIFGFKIVGQNHNIVIIHFFIGIFDTIKRKIRLQNAPIIVDIFNDKTSQT